MSREKPAAEATAPFKEAIEMIREAGGEAFRNCFQCGLCTASLSLERRADLHAPQEDHGV